LVFCELSGVSREQKETEVELVTALVRELWISQINAETNLLASESGNFWRDCSFGTETYEGACGIITPHHEHINRLKTSISNDLGLDRKEIFIGTVDKLQGKERKTVIVSYGVSENEKISSESEFIFSRNRFNVSITRGKAKTIVFLSDVIAEPNLTTNIMAANDVALKKGIDFIHNFVSYMKDEESGESLAYVEYPYIRGDVSLKVWKKKLFQES
jgi:ribosomal protein S24E